jgi:capsular exopolysaccharide synthesis family protein
MNIQNTLERAKRKTAAGEAERRDRPDRGESVDGADHRIAPVCWSAHQPPAQLDSESLRLHGLHPPPDLTVRVQNEYRSIRREVLTATLEQVGPDGHRVGPIVVVTSALPGDGKSYTAVNLALALAGEGVRETLLIDGDTIKRSLSIACGVEDRPGLMELLAHPDAGFLEYICPTNQERLHLLPAGIRPQDGGDLCSGGRVKRVFDSIRSALTGHIVVVDTPPILLSSDTPVLTDVAGQVVLVVRAGHTLQDSVKEAISLIRETVPVGVVLNAWSPAMAAEKTAYTAFEEYAR